MLLATIAVGVVGLLASGRDIAADNSRWGANYFPNVTLTTQDGVRVRFYDDLLKGKIVAINLIYTTCKYACPLETARLAQVQTLLGDRMGRDVFFYSITIDPDHDTPPVLKEYAQRYHAGPGWLFLTGRVQDIESISRKLGIYSVPNPASKDGHAPSLIVGNEATGQWMRNSAVDNARFLANTIGNWMNSWKTAKAGRSYTEATRLSLDPGRYGFSTHCAPCHTIGAGRKIGPDLAGVTATRDRRWLARFIASPQQVLAEGDPIAVSLFDAFKPLQMPSLDLGSADVSAIIDYIEAQSGGVAAQSPAPSMPPTPAVAPPPAVPEAADMLEPYLRIQEALSADTLAGARHAAQTMSAWAVSAGPRADGIRAASLALAAAVDLADARSAFGALSELMVPAVKSARLDAARDVHVAYCPMVRKSWLQKGTEIRNPFYGSAMLDCGRLDDAPAAVR